MSRARVLPAILATLLVPAALTPAAGAAGKSCRAQGGKTILQNPQTRVYQVKTGDGATLYGCRKSNGRRLRLDTASDDGAVRSDRYERIRLNGTAIAWVSLLEDQSCKADCPPGFEPLVRRIAQADVRTRESRSLRATPIGDALVVSANGGVAWAAAPAAGSPIQIRTSLRGEEIDVIDEGAIDTTTLHVERTIISWVKDGTERYARLRP